MKITSVNNDLVKETARLLQKRYRDETGLFLIEGEKAVKEAFDAKLIIKRLFCTEGFEGYPNRIETTEAVLAKISDAKTAPKVVAVAKQPEHKWNNEYKKVVLLEGIKDAGNLGTILRTSAAFGIDAVVLYGDTVDLYNPKCVRSAVGNLWKIPVFKLHDLSIFTHYERIATLPLSKGTTPLKEYKPEKKALVMFGSEADGLSEELKDFATKWVNIEMSGDVESLNLSVAAGVILYNLQSFAPNGDR